MNPEPTNDVSGPIDITVAENVLRQGEIYLASQLQSALAADQRATTIATLFGGFSAAIAAVSLGYWDKTNDLPILAAGLVASASMAVGALLCLWAARPVNFFYAGNHPESWMSVIRRPAAEILIGEALNYQDHILANDKVLVANGKHLWRGAVLAMISPIIALAVWFVLGATCLSCQVETGSVGSPEQSSSDEPSRISP